jgi:cell division protein FtsQ
VLADEEPKYLRRQKPLVIKRRKFGRKAWISYLRVALWTGVGITAAWMAYEGGQFLMVSPQMALLHPDQIAISGNHYVQPASILEFFAADRGKSVLRIPLQDRRAEIAALPWVQRAVVRRVLPNRIQVEVTERAPIAFLRQGSGTALIDIHGAIFDRPLQGDFQFPVVKGITAGMSLDNREQRMRSFADFMQQLESARPGASSQVSEVDLSDVHDVRATLTGLNGAVGNGSPEAVAASDVPILVHFGDTDFATKYQTLVSNIGQWRATTGTIQSVDLRFSGEAIVNPDVPVTAGRHGERHAVLPVRGQSR